MMKKIIISLALISLVLLPNISLVLAQAAGSPSSTLGQQNSTNGSNYALENPLGNGSSNTTLYEIIQNVIKAALGLIGVVALIMFIVGGFKIMTAQGDGKKVKSGLDTLLWAVLGLVLIFASRILLNTVLNALTF